MMQHSDDGPRSSQISSDSALEGEFVNVDTAEDIRDGVMPETTNAVYGRRSEVHVIQGHRSGLYENLGQKVLKIAFGRGATATNTVADRS